MKLYNPSELKFTKYLFFTGKGGVGKTTTACATGIQLADQGAEVMLVSTDPASNLQDVFQTNLTNHPKAIAGVPNLKVANFDPETAATEYRERVIGPYRGLLPESALVNMAEQLSGSCTVEIAAFNEFANFLTDPKVAQDYDYILFDTAPTGHTLRMLQLPAAWHDFLDENTTGTSCLGQLSGLGDKKEMYETAVNTLGDPKLTTLWLVTRPQKISILEATRASKELKELGISNQKLIVNGLLDEVDDSISTAMQQQQARDLAKFPKSIQNFESFYVPLRAYNITGLAHLRELLKPQQPKATSVVTGSVAFPELDTIVADFIRTDKKILFIMGKGGVGKTTVAIQVAKALAKAGKSVRLATTDPADHLDLYHAEDLGIAVSHIDEAKVLQDYKETVLAKAAEAMDLDHLAYVKEDLRSPCTQEIAVFRAFAEIVAKADHEVVVIDTAPTGHTLLLLDSTQNYAKEVQRSTGEVPESIQKLLPRLQNQSETEVLMVTLPETTPIYESVRLAKDLKRAKIAHTWWLVNQSMLATKTKNPILAARATSERPWIQKVAEISGGHYAVHPWTVNFEENWTY